MTREEAIKTLKDRIEQYTGGVRPGEREILLEAFAALCGPEWVRTVDRLPTAEDAGIDGVVAFCYRDNWDCFNRLEKWSDILPRKYTYWHRMLKAPKSEE